MKRGEAELPDSELKAWAEGVVGDVPVVLTPPGSSHDAERGVSIHLLELTSDPPFRTSKTAPLQLSLRYVITTWAEEPEVAHRMLIELAFAAMDVAWFDFEPTAIPASTWMALGVPPQAVLMLSVPLRRERQEPETHYVKEHLSIELATGTTLNGIVLGPEDVPIVGAVVELPDLKSMARTDRKGAFSFGNVPRLSGNRKLRVRSKGLERQVTIEEPADGPLIIRFDPLSEEH